jgi:hypothetical protein
VVPSRLALALCLPLVAPAQSGAYFRHSVTAGAGLLEPVSGWVAGSFERGAAVHGEYGFRFWRYAQAEAGYAAAWPSQYIFTGHNSYVERQTMHFIDYGARGILPLFGDRLQLSAGFGGARVIQNQFYSFVTGNLMQYSGRASAALDRKGRYRLGSTARFYRDPGRPTQQWLILTGDFSVSF